MSELSAVIDQLRRAFDGDAWHGDSVLEILGGVSVEDRIIINPADSLEEGQLVRVSETASGGTKP